MKIIAYTQRVEIIESYGERRDCADQMLPKFLRCCGFLPIPIPNVPELVDDFLLEIKPRGIFLSGGNSLVKYGGNAPERDQTETLLIDYAIEHDIPTFGICRGMQFIADRFGAKLEPIENHVRVRHAISGRINREVNSFHTLGLFDVPNCLKILARADDNSVEAIAHSRLKIAAIGWHPEREINFADADVSMLKNFFERGAWI